MITFQGSKSKLIQILKKIIINYFSQNKYLRNYLVKIIQDTIQPNSQTLNHYSTKGHFQSLLSADFCLSLIRLILANEEQENTYLRSRPRSPHRRDRGLKSCPCRRLPSLSRQPCPSTKHKHKPVKWLSLHIKALMS